MSNELIAEIESAWSGATPPASDNISMPTYDDEGTSDYFRGKTWRGHTAAQLRSLDFSLTILTPEAFAYFLPAYMIADIQDPEASDINAQYLLFNLSSGQSSDPNRTVTILSLLSSVQRKAVTLYFEHVRARDGECVPGEYDEVLSLGSSNG